MASRSVEAYWSFTANKAGKSLVLPDGRCDIILRYHAHTSEAPVAIITGPSTRAYAVSYEAGDSWLGMRLRPNHGVVLWQGEIENAADRVLRAQDAIELVPELAKIDRNTLSFAHLAQAMEAITIPERRSSHDNQLSQAINALHVSGGRLPIAELAVSAGCSLRHLHRLFRSSIGLSAKTYAQLVQFHRTLKLVRQERLPITAAAFEGGYADQSHLTRAFRRFGSFTPSNVPNELSLPELFG